MQSESDGMLCYKIPHKIPPRHNLYAVWSIDGNDYCICPICNDSNCLYHNCECYNNTTSPKLIGVSSSFGMLEKFELRSTQYTYKLCLKYFNSEVHVSDHVHFFYESIDCPFTVKSESSANITRTFIRTVPLSSKGLVLYNYYNIVRR